MGYDALFSQKFPDKATEIFIIAEKYGRHDIVSAISGLLVELA
jgi:hypothetical protein